MSSELLLSLAWLLPLAYLLGSVPTAVWVGKLFHGIDIREHGSGNAGATNVMRVLGPASGIPVLIFDMCKGWAAVMLRHFQHVTMEGSETWVLISIALGAAAVVGHIFPVFAGFRGGKGVATIAGVCFALQPAATGAALGVFVIVLLAWKYVSVASMSAGISFPLFLMLVFHEETVSLAVFSVIAALLLVYTHRSNIRRLMQGKENRANFLVRKGK